MSSLRRRLQKLETGRRGFHVIFVPDYLHGPKRNELIEEYRRRKHLSAADQIIAMDESDRGA